MTEKKIKITAIFLTIVFVVLAISFVIVPRINNCNMVGGTSMTLMCTVESPFISQDVTVVFEALQDGRVVATARRTVYVSVGQKMSVSAELYPSGWTNGYRIQALHLLSWLPW